MTLTREEMTAVYAGGVEAVIAVIEHLQAMVTAQQEQIEALSARVKELEDHATTTSRTSSKPPSSDGYQRHAADSRRDVCGGPRGGGRADQGGLDPRGRGAS